LKKGDISLDGTTVYLRLLSPEDVGDAYLGWMKDDAVVRFMESRGEVYTLERLRDYVRKMVESPDDFLFGIFSKADGRHIGNVKVGNIDWREGLGYAGLLIGDRTRWGHGHGSESIRLISRYAIEALGLRRVYAGIYPENTGSYRAFLKAGFRKVSVLKNYKQVQGRSVDVILTEKSADETQQSDGHR
jgi:[ribosomal protein S5]-alanine N-acetyltransferase